MDHIWTPWRFQYISSTRNPEGCVFCRLTGDDEDRANLILWRGANVYVVLNRFPYTAGHLMVVTYRHVASLEDASEEELIDLTRTARDCLKALTQAYRPDGFNVGLNLGKSAGAGVAGHLHMHVVPRWQGDGNFVSVVGETRVIPEDLETTFEKLKPFFE